MRPLRLPLACLEGLQPSSMHSSHSTLCRGGVKKTQLDPLKNTNKTVQTTLKPILEKKIKEILKKGADGFNEYEDIFEFLSNESKGGERDMLVHEIALSWLMMMEKGIKEEQMFEIQKHIPDMI